MPPRRVVIIGGGPAGLVQLKVLLHFARHGARAGAAAIDDDDGCSPEFDPILLEQASDIGGTFAWRSYENGTLVSSKQLTAFSDCKQTADRRRSEIRLGTHQCQPRYPICTQIDFLSTRPITSQCPSTSTTSNDTLPASASTRTWAPPGNRHRSKALLVSSSTQKSLMSTEKLEASTE